MSTPLRFLVWCLFLAAFAARDARAQDEPQRGWRIRVNGAHGSVESVVPAFPHVGSRIDADAAAELELPRSGRYRFALELTVGTGTLEIAQGDGKMLATAKGSSSLAWTPWLELPAATVRLQARVQGGGGWRAWWEMAQENGRGFRAEPIPSRALTAGAAIGSSSPIAAHDLALLSNKGCLHCHAGELPEPERVFLRAPELADIGARVDLGWLERWIRDPAAQVAQADMPALFADTPDDRARVRDLVEFLVPQPIAASTGSRASDTDVARGRSLYHELGCIGCHGARESPAVVLGEAFLEAEVPNSPLRRVLPDLAPKWRRAALEAFLRDPAKSHPDGRMPSFLLDEAEARALAAYLMPSEPARAAHVPDAARALRGAEAWKQAGCQSCHIGEGGLRPPLEQRSLAELDLGKTCTATRYALRDGDAERLERAARFAAHSDDAQREWLRSEFAFERNACGGCHARAGDGGIPYELRAYFRSEYEETDLGDEGRLPPDLAGVGTKLHASWIQHVLDTGARARPYLRARMPVYPPAAVDGLGEALARAEGVLPGSDAREPECSDDAARIGRDLLGREQLSCIACHLYKDYPPNGTPGPALEHFGERLRYEWFRSFAADPSRAKPGTRMPTFGQAGKSTLTRVLEGDMHAQIDAMWCYFALGEDAPVPPGVQKTRSLELVVGERPIVLRTFLEQTGPRGIAVGLPNGFSYAYDAGACRLVDAWKGAFLDASGPWAERGGNNAEGQGARIWQAPSGPALVLGALPAEWPVESPWKWSGYTLDERGEPVFEARAGAVTLRERLFGALLPQPLLRRHMELSALAPRQTVAFRAGLQGRLTVGIGDPAHRREIRDGQVFYEFEADADGRLTLEWEVNP